MTPQQAPALERAMPMGPAFWFLGQGIRVARQGLPTSIKARGKVPAMELPPPEIDKELVQ